MTAPTLAAERVPGMALTTRRWHRRPALGVAIRAFIVIGPVIAGVVTSSLLVRVLTPPAGAAWVVAWWCGLFVVSVGVVVGADRALRRLTPLATLFNLTLVFPDQAPSRFKVVRRSSDVDAIAVRRPGRRTAAGAGEASEQIVALVAALDAHDRSTRGHSERTGVYADMLAREMNVPVGARERLRWAALLHDVGKLTVSAETLKATGRPKDDDWDQIRRHPEEGARLAAALMPWLGDWGRAIPEHHERFDGAGYPKGLAGEDISLAARIVAVADSYDVMTAGRPYRKPLTPDAARAEIARGAGTRYDPRVCRALMQVSLGRPRRTFAVFGWLGQLPFLLGFDRLGHALVAATQTAGSVAAAGVGTVALMVAGVVAPPGETLEAAPEPAPVVTVSRPAAAGPVPTPAPASASPAVPAANVSQPEATVRPSAPTATTVPVPTIAPAAAAAVCTGGQSLAPAKDAWISNDAIEQNHGSDDRLSVRSKFRPDLPVESAQNDRRTLVAFASPSVPAGCAITSATLRLFAAASSGDRVIDVRRLASDWQEDGVLWSNQPATTGPVASVPSGEGWRGWDVTAMVSAGVPAGFLVKDREEGSTGFDQEYVSREGGIDAPRLVIRFGAR